MKHIKDILDEGTKELTEAGIEDAALDAWLLLEYCFNITRAGYYTDPRRQMPDSGYAEYMALIKRRRHRMPLQYITGRQEFMGLTFKVTPDVLIPRQDTEILAEAVQDYINTMKTGEKDLHVLDLCTGSGCIIIALAALCGLKNVCGADISDRALKLAEDNARYNRVMVQWIQSDLFERIDNVWDVIVSNPPYIKSEEIEGLMPEVRLFEPELALDGKADGLFFYRSIIGQAAPHLYPGGALFLEIGFDQGAQVTDLFTTHGFENARVIKDLTGLDRVVWAEKRRRDIHV